MTRFYLLIGFAIALIACHEKTAGPQVRTYRMGFANSAPRFDNLALFIQSLEMWTLRADAAIVSTEVPWAELLAGTPATTYVNANYKGLVDYYRVRNLKLWVYIDPQNGLDRAADASALVTAGKSISQPEMQKIYQRFVIVMDSILQPDHLGLALETNLIRDAAAPSIYLGVKQAVNAVAAQLTAKHTRAKLSISIQADHAWGKLTGSNTYSGINQDFLDFPFIQELGLSSYPYFGFDRPADIPDNYYMRLIEGKSIQVFVSEGGWTSASVTTPTRTFRSSPEIQQEYVMRHAQLLDKVNATALFQLTFTDIDISSIPPTVSPTLNYFAFIGLADTQFQSKPALITWDETFKRPIKDGN